MAIIILAISVYVVLVAYLPNVSFSQLPFLTAGRSSIEKNHMIIHGSNNNNNSSSNNSLSSGGTNSFSYSLNKITNTIKPKSLPLQTKPTEITNVSQKGVDKFGIAMLYPTKPNGEQWYMNMSSPASDPRFNLNNPYKHVGKSYRIFSIRNKNS